MKHGKTDRPGWSQWGSYAKLYEDYMLDPDTIYIKMDDDIVSLKMCHLRLMKLNLSHFVYYYTPSLT